MTLYRNNIGTELTVCDGCGVADDGTKPGDVLAQLGFTPVDLGAGLRDHLAASGLPSDGADLKIKDYCPTCNKDRKP